MKPIEPRSVRDQSVHVPGSKSISHRMMICACLGSGTSRIDNLLDSEDLTHTTNALTAMGAVVSKSPDRTVTVKGFGGRPSPFADPIYLGNSGTSMRLLAGIAALGKTTYTLTGDDRMCERPMGELLSALKGLDVTAESASSHGTPPVSINGSRLEGGSTLLDCSKSSQYLSALLMMGALTTEGLIVDLTGPPVSVPYIDLTLDVMATFGVTAKRLTATRYQVQGGQAYQAGSYAVEPDLSNAGYFWAAAAVTGARIGVANIGETSLQGDFKQVEILEKMGCTVTREKDTVWVKGGPLSGVSVDMSDTPDAVPAIAVAAAFAKGTTRISNIGHLRIKECDRIDAVSTQLIKMGIDVTQGPDFMEITGGTPKGAVIETFNDHRIAMAFSVAGLRTKGVEIENPGCVAKSFPTYWELFDAL